MNVLLLPSAHGRGHHARMAVLADALRREGASAQLGHPSLPPLDFGRRLWDAREGGRVPAEARALEAGSARAVATWREALARVAPDLVVSDADPWPLAGARAAGIPSLLVSNFTWVDVAAPWAAEHDWSWLEALYEPTRTLALPLTMPLRGAGERRNVPHLAWPREHLDVDRPRVLALFAMGFGNPVLPPSIRAEEPTDLEVVEGVPAPPARGALRIVPAPGLPGERMHLADIAVAKPGYGAVSEAIAARTPMLLVARSNGAEDASTSKVLVEGGVGVASPVEREAVLPRREERERMRHAYEKRLPWMRCDPAEVARAVLESPVPPS